MRRLTDLARRVASRLLSRLRGPRIVTIRAFDPAGCRFEVRDAVESFRVERFGGEEEFLRQILDELRPGDTLFDVGACVGMVAIHAARRGANVVAFEPDPFYGGRLDTNLALNGTRVQVVRWAVSDGDGEATLFTDGAGGASPSLMQKGSRGKVTVKTRAIDGAVSSGELPAPSVVKLDIEGAEILALRGMQDLLTSPRAPRAIFLELHPDMLPAFGSSAEEVRALLASAGYAAEHEITRAGQIHFVYRKAPMAA
jgi:FkbM family methyltransferase